MPVIDPNDGQTNEAFGRLSADQWLSGKVPWWNPYCGVGLPLAAEMQSSSLFLPFALLFALPNSVVLVRITLQVLAAIGAYLLGRELRLTTIASALLAVLWSLNGTFAWFMHASIYPLPFLPFLLLGVERIAQSLIAGARQRYIGPAYVAVSIAFSLFAGFPETAYLNGLLAAVWIVARLFLVPRPLWLNFVALSLAGAATGIALAAPILVPFFEYLNRSAQLHSNFGDLYLPASALLLHLLPYSFGPLQAYNGTIPSPYLAVDWGNVGGYLTTATLVLAFFALLRRKISALRIGLALWSLVAFARILGKLGTISLFRLLPGDDVLATWRYITPSVEMALALLAAFAISDWERATSRNRLRAIVALALATAAIGYSLFLGSDIVTALWQAKRAYHLWPILSVLYAALSLAGITVVLSQSPKPALRSVLFLLVTTEAILLFSAPMLAGFKRQKLNTGTVSYLRSHLGLQRYFALGGIRTNYSSYFQVAAINYSSLPVDRSWADFLRVSFDPTLPPADLLGDFPPPLADRLQALRTHLDLLADLGVRYVTVKPDLKPLTQWEALPVAQRPKLVFQNPIAYIFEIPNPKPYYSIQNGDCAVHNPSRESVQISCRTAGQLVRRELFYPGWSAQRQDNGASLSLTADRIFQSVQLQPGTYNIEFHYQPTHIRIAYTIAALSAGLLIAGLWADKKKKGTPEGVPAIEMQS